MSSKYSIKEMVSPGKMATFIRFKHNNIWYVTDNGFEFPIPASDISGETELLPIEKAMSLMKWINKHIKFLDQAEQEQTLA